MKIKNWIIPMVLILGGLLFWILAKNDNTWGALAYVALMILCIISLVIYGLFALLNKYLFKWDLNWWKSILLFVSVVVLGYIVLFVIVRADSWGLL